MPSGCAPILTSFISITTSSACSGCDENELHVFSSKPILNLQAADALEPVRIGGHDRRAGGVGVRSDEQVVAAA